MSSPIEIRQFASTDLPQILAMEQEAFPLDPFTKDDFASGSIDDPDLFIVAVCDGEIRGYMMTAMNGDQAEVLSIATPERFRRQGIGTRLYQYTEGVVAMNGARSVQIEVHPANSAGKAFWERRGFTFVETVPKFYNDGSDAIRMRKRVQP